MATAVEADIEALKREREEKTRQIVEKKKQVEELKLRRAQRTNSKGPADSNRRGSLDLNKSVDDLLADMRSGSLGTSQARPDAPLQELARNSKGRGARSSAAFQADRVATVSMEPHQGDVYDKSIQTEASDAGETRSMPLGRKSVAADGGNTFLKQMAERARNRTLKPEQSGARSIGGITKRAVAADDATGDGRNAGSFDAKASDVKELSAEETKSIMEHPDFQSFFQRTSLLVERTLGQDAWDLAADFSSDGAGAGENQESSEKMKHVDDYLEERWTLGRTVADARFSPHRSEMFLAAYGSKATPALSDPDGCMLVWNLAMNRRPELTFSSQSAVLTAHFHRFNPQLFFGGTYSGGVVLWDARAKSGPVMRTPLSAKGHSHPVQAMQQVGTQNATNLVTASNDGRLCVWSLAMLVHPQESIDLKNEKSSNRRDLAVTSLSFPENETNILYVGAEDGSVCQVHIHGTKVGVTESYDGHDGPVTAVDVHPHGDASQHGVEGNAEVALSCSFDWSVKLWMVKQSQSPYLVLDAFEDYVYDVSWHPTHPAVFSSVDGEGHVDLWNLNQDLESPVVRCERPTTAPVKLALNRCFWSSDGKRLGTGDSEGNLSVYALDKSLAQPRNEDFTVFQERMRSLQPVVPKKDLGYGDSRYGLGRSGYGGLDSSAGGRY